MRRTLVCLGSLRLASGIVCFQVTFGAGWEDRWTLSKWKEGVGTQGKFVASAGKRIKDEAEDMGMQTGKDSIFCGFSASFDSFSNEGKELVFQYRAKYVKDVECGGGYMNIGPKKNDSTAFGDPTPFNIMFGPDKCGYTKRTHLAFIFNYKGKNVLKKTDLAFKQACDGTSHLYRLVLRPGITVRVEIDDNKIHYGSLKEDWELLKPNEIPDPDDIQSDDRVDDSLTDDPETNKPDDWVEGKRIVDSEAKKPDVWDDEEDGGWQTLLMDNPEYKDEWYTNRISNLAYMGFWEAKYVPNPEYEDGDYLYRYDDLGFIGFDLLQVKGGTFFDSVIITDDWAEAGTFAKKWKELSEVEKSKKKEEEESKKADDKKNEEEDEDDDDAEDSTDSEER